MDPAALQRVKVLVRPAAWAYHSALPDDQRADLDMVYAEFGDPRLVAAYMLSVACEAAQRAAAAASREQVKRLESGADKIEFFQASSELAADADAWCRRAEELRDEVALERSRGDTLTGTVVLDIGTVF